MNSQCANAASCILRFSIWDYHEVLINSRSKFVFKGLKGKAKASSILTEIGEFWVTMLLTRFACSRGPKWRPLATLWIEGEFGNAKRFSSCCPRLKSFSHHHPPILWCKMCLLRLVLVCEGQNGTEYLQFSMIKTPMTFYHPAMYIQNKKNSGEMNTKLLLWWVDTKILTPWELQLKTLRLSCTKWISLINVNGLFFF